MDWSCVTIVHRPWPITNEPVHVAGNSLEKTDQCMKDFLDGNLT